MAVGALELEHRLRVRLQAQPVQTIENDLHRPLG